MNSDPALTPELVQSQAFSSSFRGYEQSEVRQFLARVAAELRAARDRAEHLENAWRSAEERAAHPLPLDEESLVSAVGEETAAVLRAARSAASGLRTRAEEEAARIVDEARLKADQLRAESEEVMGRALKAADEAAQRISEKAKADVADLLARAKEEASALKAASEQERHLMIEGASATRDRILDDLGRRRRVATVQIEQLRVGRERLLDAYGVVRRTLEIAHDELTKADAEARAAADEVGRRAHAGADVQADDAEAATSDEPEPKREVAVAVPTDAPAAGLDAQPEAFEPPPEAFRPSPDAAPAGTSDAPAATSDGPAENVEARGTQPGRALDALFARIRAGHTASEGEPPALRESLGTAAARPAVLDPAESPAVAEPGASEAAALGAASNQTTPTEGSAAPDGFTEDEQLLQRRESAVAELDTGLSRRLKRLLQDEHNDLLDRLRSSRGVPDAARLMPDLKEQETRFARVARVFAQQAALAGIAFASELIGGHGGSDSKAPDVDDLVRDAASVAATDVRRRVEKAVAGCPEADPAAVADAVGAVYREWKNQRVELLSGDLVVSAFSRGTLHGVAPGTPLRWIAEDLGGPCPDCDDDALAGALPKGEPFPTGQIHPPAHSGCRCLLVPSMV